MKIFEGGSGKACAVVLIAFACVSACGDDEGAPGDPDGSAGSGGGGSTGGAGAATSSGGKLVTGGAGGNPVTGGSKSSGGTPAAGGDASVGGGAPDDGGDGSAGDASVGEAGGDGGAAAVDASPDGADGVVHRDPPCPLSSFPYGTYHLKTNAAEEYLDSLGGSCSAELGRRSMTVSIAPSSTFPGCDQVTIDTEAGRFMFPTRFDCALFEESQAGVHFWDSVCRTGEPPQCFYRDEFSIEIDRSTGVVTSFSYDVVKSPDPSRERHDRGTGWPVCAATEASPPSWVPEPPVPTAGSLCYGTGVPMPVLALGCRFENVWGFPGPPTCESAFNLCKAVPGATCQNTSEGYAAHCCVP